jgi:hypothetical protein
VRTNVQAKVCATVHWRNRILIAAASLVGVAMLAGCAASTAGSSRPSQDPDVGTSSPSSSASGGPGGSAVSCPESFGELHPANGPVSPPITGPRTLGVPNGARQVLVCYYGPFTSVSAATLRWNRTLDGGPATALLAVVDQTPQRQMDPIGPMNCPKDNGSAAIMRFTYADQPTEDVFVRLTGCRLATSDHGTTMFRDDIARAVLALH